MSKTHGLIVGDYMQRKVTAVHPDDTVEEVVKLMLEKKTNGTVVVDDENNVVGILSSWDIVQHIVPDYLETDSNLAAFEAADVFCKRTKEVAQDPVSLMMTTKVRTAKEDDTLIHALTLLAKFHIRQLPVVDEHNHLIGYINRTDIKRAVGDVLREDTH